MLEPSPDAPTSTLIKVGSLSDDLLAGGVLPAIGAVHGEIVTVLTGKDASKQFTAVIEIEQDVQVGSDLGMNPRARRMCRFIGCVPRVSSQDQIQTGDGKTWFLVKRDFDDYLTHDFELIQQLLKG